MSVRELLYSGSPYDDFDPAPYPPDLQGWHSEHPLLTNVITALRPVRIVEVGTWKGASAVHMARTVRSLGLAAEIVCVDTWLGSPEHWNRSVNPEWYQSLNIKNGRPDIYYTFLANVMREGFADIITPFPATSENAAVFFSANQIKFDFVYLDAAHEYNAVKRDLAMYFDLLSDRGILVGDDYVNWDSVTRAANDFAIERGVPIIGEYSKFCLTKGSVSLSVRFSV